MGRLKELLMKNKLQTIIISSSVLIVLLIVIFAVSGRSDIYKMVTDAIEKTESKEDFMLEFSSSSLIMTGSVSQQIDSSGYIAAADNLENVFVQINTKSSTPSAPQNDFDITASMYSDGEYVYETVNGKDTPLDMTVEEFNDIISEYGLYRYNEPDVEKAVFEENEIYKGSGDVTVTLKTPGRQVLQSYAAKIAEITGENISTNDLVVTRAQVVYSIYNGEVGAQTCNFEVEYTTQSGEKIRYSSSAHVLYFSTQEEESVRYIDTTPETED